MNKPETILAPFPYSADEQRLVDKYESAARALCMMDGIDPEKSIDVPHPRIEGANCLVPMWQTHIRKLASMDRIMLALWGTQEDRIEKDEPAVQ